MLSHRSERRQRLQQELRRLAAALEAAEALFGAAVE